VRDTAVATLNSIIRNTTLGEVAQNKEVAARSQKGLNYSSIEFTMNLLASCTNLSTNYLASRLPIYVSRALD